MFMPNTFMMQELMRTFFDQYTENSEDKNTPEEPVVICIRRGKEYFGYITKQDWSSYRSVRTKFISSSTGVPISIFSATLSAYILRR